MATQIDAKKQAINFYYDNLNRLKGKVFVSGPVDPASYFRPGTDPGYAGYTYGYRYDDATGGNHGRGRRTRIEGPLGTGGYTTWSYDSRGRVTMETKSTTGADAFKTQWTYDAADRITSMVYPGGNGGQAGETVRNGYTAGWLPNTVTSTVPVIYLESASYDAAGRPELLTLGSNALKLDYVYNPWTTQGGRLLQLNAGIPTNLTSLQAISYTYDAVGNVLTIRDYKAGNPQTQTFSYDSLDRMISAEATHGRHGRHLRARNLWLQRGRQSDHQDLGRHLHQQRRLAGQGLPGWHPHHQAARPGRGRQRRQRGELRLRLQRQRHHAGRLHPPPVRCQRHHLHPGLQRREQPDASITAALAVDINDWQEIQAYRETYLEGQGNTVYDYEPTWGVRRDIAERTRPIRDAIRNTVYGYFWRYLVR